MAPLKLIVFLFVAMAGIAWGVAISAEEPFQGGQDVIALDSSAPGLPHVPNPEAASVQEQDQDAAGAPPKRDATWEEVETCMFEAARLDLVTKEKTAHNKALKPEFISKQFQVIEGKASEELEMATERLKELALKEGREISEIQDPAEKNKRTEKTLKAMNQKIKDVKVSPVHASGAGAKPGIKNRLRTRWSEKTDFTGKGTGKYEKINPFGWAHHSTGWVKTDSGGWVQVDSNTHAWSKVRPDYKTDGNLAWFRGNLPQEGSDPKHLGVSDVSDQPYEDGYAVPSGKECERLLNAVADAIKNDDDGAPNAVADAIKNDDDGAPNAVADAIKNDDDGAPNAVADAIKNDDDGAPNAVADAIKNDDDGAPVVAGDPGVAGGKFIKKNFMDGVENVEAILDTSAISHCMAQVEEIKGWNEKSCPKADTSINIEAPLGKDLKRSVVKAMNSLKIAEKKFANKKELLKTDEKREEFQKKLWKVLESSFKSQKYEQKLADSGRFPAGVCKSQDKDTRDARIFELRDEDILLKDCEKMFKLATSAHKSVYQDSYDSACWTMIIISAVVVFAVLIAVIMMFCKSSNADE